MRVRFLLLQHLEKFALLALMLGVLVVLLATASPAQSAPLRAPATGAAKIFGLDDGGVLSGSDTALDLAATTGVNWVRTSVSWKSIEGTRGTYNFAGTDALMNRLFAAGLSPIVYLTENPTWAANTWCGPVDTNSRRKVEALANVMGALAARYPQVKIWALYNEIDHDADPAIAPGGCFGSRTPGGLNNNGVPDPYEYAILMAASWKSIHAANPKAKLAMGAVAFDNFNQSTAPADYPGSGVGGVFNYYFLATLFDYMRKVPLPQGQKYMDMLLFNYYEIYGPYWELRANGYGIQAKADYFRKRLSLNQLPVVPLFVTESGEDSRPEWIGLLGQARCLDMIMVRGAATKLKGVIWWTFRDFPDSAPFPRNTWKYGIVDQNLLTKPSYTALKTLATELQGRKFKATLTNGPGFTGIEAYAFGKLTNRKIVVWSNSIRYVTDKPNCSWERTPRVATFVASRIRVVDYLGKESIINDNGKRDLDPRAGLVAIEVGGNPQIVQLNP